MGPVVVIQHLEPEAPWAIGSACRRRGLDVEVVRTDLGDAVPADPDACAGIVVMGGPMSATSDEGYATRRDEFALVAAALESGVPTLGVCLGAQVLARAAGGRVHPGHGPEIGWAPIRLHPEARADPLFAGAPAELVVLHWHGDTFELPPDAVRLAASDAYEHQAFRIGPCAWGLQFHLEVTVEAVEAFLSAFPDDVVGVPGGVDAIRADTPGSVAALEPHRDRLLDAFATAVRAGVDSAR